MPLSGGSAPYQMSPTSVADWAQQDAPSEATAIFPPDQVPTNPPASYSRATITYLDPDGRAVNTAEPGGNISTSEYDQFGNTIRTLSAANRACAIASTCTLPDGTPALTMRPRPGSSTPTPSTQPTGWTRWSRSGPCTPSSWPAATSRSPGSTR